MAMRPPAGRPLAGPIKEGLVDSQSACRHVEIGVSGERSTILEDATDYGRLFETLARMEARARLRPAAADAIR